MAMTLNVKKDSKLKSSINLMIIQVGLFLLPILAMPYIVSTVGIERYGAFVFFHTVMGLLSVIVNYGFQHTGVRDIANCRTVRKLRHEYSHIFYSRLVILLAVLLISIFLLSLEKFRADKVLYLYSYLYLFAMVFDISFVYQGLEQLKDYAIINLIGSAFVLLLLFSVIKDEADYIYLPVVFSLPRILLSLFAIYLIYFRLRVIPVVFSIKGIVGKLTSGFSCFVSNILMVIYTRATLVLLGFLTTNAFVGYYAIADQLVFAYLMIQGKVSSVYHPQITKAFRSSLAEGSSKASESVFLMAILSIAGMLFIQCFAYEILYLFLGDGAQHSEAVLMILSLNLISVSINSILGIQVLLSLNRDLDLLKPSLYAAAVNLILGGIFIYFFKHIGAAATVVTIELGICTYMYVKVRNYGVKLLTWKIIGKLGKYTVALMCIALGLRGVGNGLPVGVLVKLLIVGLMYSVCVAVILQWMNMVDFRSRRMVFENIKS